MFSRQELFDHIVARILTQQNPKDQKKLYAPYRDKDDNYCPVGILIFPYSPYMEGMRMLELFEKNLLSHMSDDDYQLVFTLRELYGPYRANMLVHSLRFYFVRH